MTSWTKENLTVIRRNACTPASSTTQACSNFPVPSAHTMEIAGKLMGKGIDFRSHHRQQLLQKNIHPEPDSGQSPLESITFLTDGASSAPSARARWSFTGLTARIWTASLTSCALRKAWKLPFSSMRQDLRNLRSACAPVSGGRKQDCRVLRRRGPCKGCRMLYERQHTRRNQQSVRTHCQAAGCCIRQPGVRNIPCITES